MEAVDTPTAPREVEDLIADLEVELLRVHEFPQAQVITRNGCGTTEDTVRNLCAPRVR